MSTFFPELKIKHELLDYDAATSCKDYKSESDNSTEVLKAEDYLKKDETSCSNTEDTENVKPSASESHYDPIGMMKILSKCEDKMKADVIKEMQLLEESCEHDDHSPKELINFDEATPSSPIPSLTSEKSDVIGENSNSVNKGSDNKSRHSSSSSSTSCMSKTPPPLPLNTIVLPSKYQHLVEILQENKNLTEHTKVLEVNCILNKMTELIHQYNCVCFTCRRVGCGGKFSTGSNRDRHERKSCKVSNDQPSDLSSSDPFERKSKRMRKQKTPSEGSVDDNNEQERKSKPARKPRATYQQDMFEYITKRSLNKVVGETAKSADESEEMEQEKPQEESSAVQIEATELEPQSGKCGFGLRLRKKSEPKGGTDAEYNVVEPVEIDEVISKEEEAVIKKEEEEESSDSDGPSTPSNMTDRNANEQPGRRIKEKKNWCWNTSKKKKCQRVKLVMNQDQFNYKKIHPYHVYKPALETSYHNPFPWTDSETNCRNVFDMMISDITNLTRLVPVIKDRRAYKTGSTRLRKDLKNRLQINVMTVKGRNLGVHKTVKKKIKVFSPDLQSQRTADSSPQHQIRRTKSIGPNLKVQPRSLQYNILDHKSHLLCQPSYQKKNVVHKQIDDVFAPPAPNIPPHYLTTKNVPNVIDLDPSISPLPTTSGLTEFDVLPPPIPAKTTVIPRSVHPGGYFRTESGTVIRILSVPGKCIKTIMTPKTIGYTKVIESLDKVDKFRNILPVAEPTKTSLTVNPFDYNEPESDNSIPINIQYPEPPIYKIPSHGSTDIPQSESDDILVRRVFPNNQGTGLNLLKSMRATNKVMTVEKPINTNFDFNRRDSDQTCDFYSDTLAVESGYFTHKMKCSKTSTIFTNDALSGAAFGPCFTVCKKHLMGAGHARNNEIVLKSNKLTRYVYQHMHKHNTSTHDMKTQTTDDTKLLGEMLEAEMIELTSEKEKLLADNKLMSAEIKTTKISNYNYSQRIKEFDQQLSIEKELRLFLTEENEQKEISNDKLVLEIGKMMSEIQGDDELNELKRAVSAQKNKIEELHDQNKGLTEEVERVKQDNINLKLTKLDKSDSDDSVIERLKRENRYLTKQGSLKDKKIKTLQISVTSISEALRQQTKTVCDLSRKSSVDISPEEENNHKIYVGFESLVKITCKLLGSLQRQNEKKIEEPEAMRKLCQMVSGDENLFSLFRKIFSKEGDEEEDEDKESVEKRVLFLINLMSYFYSGADETPSASGLKTLL